MGLFDQYLPYGQEAPDPNDQSFSMGLNDAVDLPDFDAESYATYQPTPSRADSYKSKLAETMGKWDEDGRFGLDEGDRSQAKNAKWSELGKRLARAGFSHSYQGYGNAMQDLGGAMGGAEEKTLDNASNKNLMVELAKLDMEKNLSAAEKDRLTLEIAQNDFDDKQKARVIGAQIYDAEMPPEKVELLVSSVKDPGNRAIVASKLNIARLYMHAGDTDRAMKEMEEAMSIVPSAAQERIDMLYKAKEAEAKATAKGQATGKLDAQLEASRNLPEGMEMGEGGNIRSIDPLETQAKQAQIAAVYDGIADRKIDNDRLARQEEKQTATELKYEQGRKREIFRALTGIASIKSRGYDYSGGKLWSGTGKERRSMDTPADLYGEAGKTIEELLKLGGDSNGVLSQYPQLQEYLNKYGNPTAAINAMFEDEKHNRFIPVVSGGNRRSADTRPKK